MEDTASRHLPAGGQEAYWLPVMAWDAESSDEELMLGYRDGDAAAFDVLYARHKGGLYRYLQRQCRNATAAEELFQDVWMNLIRARAGYTVQAKFTTYLYHLAHNRLIDHYRKNSQAAISSFEDADSDALEELADERVAPPDSALDSRQQALRLLELLAELPEAQREAFLLQQEGGMSVEEIARATGVNRETAKSRLRYAMAKLREGMGKWR
jgi:RNA polymerase sigma-70 factor (ECF subfamily)